MLTFNLLGCCIIRDLFRICDTENRYKIVKFIQSVSPVSFCEEPQNIPRIKIEELSSFSGWSNFSKRNVCTDICKTVFTTVSENPSDYIALDLCELRFRHCRVILENGDSFYMTRNKYTVEMLDKVKTIGDFRIVSTETALDLPDDEIYVALDKYVSFLKRHYSPDRVILIKNLPARLHLDDLEKTFFEYSASSTALLKGKLSKYYKYFEQHFSGIHIIEPSEHSLGYVQHTWGKDPLHFVDEYYKYLYDAINIIVSCGDKNAISALKESYDHYFSLLEKSKRMEYFIATHNLSNNLLKNSCFVPSQEGILKEWDVVCSKDSKYDSFHKILSCGEEVDHCWAILNQNIPKDKLLGKTFTFSVRFITESAYLNIGIYYKMNIEGKHKHVYLYAKRFYSYGEERICSDTVHIPDVIEGIDTIIFSVYTNTQNAKTILYEVKLEEGTVSTLF